MKSLPLEVLQAFVTFIESPNITLAARSLGISQPLLTKQLKLLESRARQPVFQFDGRKKVPTRYGRELHLRIRGHLSALESDLHAFEAEQPEARNAELRIGGRKEILEAFAAKLSFPGALTFLEMTGQETLEALLARKIDLGVTQRLPDSHGFIAKPFLKDAFCIAYPSAWKLKTENVATLLSLLRERPRLSYGSSDPGSALLLQPAPPVRTIANWSMIARLCSSGVGWCVAPETQISQTSAVTRLRVPASMLAPTLFYISYSKELSRMPWFHELLGEIRG